MTNKKTKQKKLTKQHSCITNKKMNPSAAALTVFNNYFAELQEKYTKAVESKQEEQQQQLAARQLTIINKPITVVPRMAQLNGLNTIDNAKQQQQPWTLFLVIKKCNPDSALGSSSFPGTKATPNPSWPACHHPA